ncbi:hypothetical protein GGQ68_002930 [Sagittula marina]|uniref:Uncharacterized protein n=1 Tax=Sagittula marina TaxID=943940 RepID=A0A7W6DPK1_9RHOB|nr:hypothetical protein [Sagittula marina]MBB3986587.1 hypothetical protein [Sagittula marina]
MKPSAETPGSVILKLMAGQALHVHGGRLGLSQMALEVTVEITNHAGVNQSCPNVMQYDLEEVNNRPVLHR